MNSLPLMISGRDGRAHFDGLPTIQPNNQVDNQGKSRMRKRARADLCGGDERCSSLPAAAGLRTKGTMQIGTSASWTHRTFSFVMGHAQLQLPMHGLQQHHNEERSEVLYLRRAGAWGQETLPDGVACEPLQARIGQG